MGFHFHKKPESRRRAGTQVVERAARGWGGAGGAEVGGAEGAA